MRRRQWLRVAALGTSSALAAGYATFWERRHLEVNRYQIAVPHLPPAFAGFRLVHLTDLHLDRLTPLEWLQEVLARAQRVGGDAIVCTGDYVHAPSTAKSVDAIWPSLSALHAPCGVFSVLGNHDHAVDTRRSLEWLERSGQSVRHRARAIERHGARLWIAGAGDFRHDTCGIDGALARVPEGDCRLVIAHDPDTADLPWRARVDLMICGHTHGGQVRLPFLGAPILPVRNKRYSSGLIATERMQVFISRGIGWAIIPVRVNCPPEIAVLELVPGAAA